MKIVEINGNHLQKSTATSPEDAFIKSEVTYIKNSKDKYFSLLYLGYFETQIQELSPFDEYSSITIGKETYEFKQFAALLALINNPNFMEQKRVYIHDFESFKSLYDQADWENLKQLLIKFANETSNHSNV